MVYYGFYDSYNHDRQYNSKDFGRLFDGVITDGVFSTVGEILATVPGEGLSVIIKSGKAWFNRTYTYNDGFVTKDIDLPDVLLPRIDVVVLEINQDISTRENAFKIIKGTPATSPSKPILTNTEVLHQYPLAYVTVKANASSFTTADIDICVGRSECPFCTPVQSVDITDLYNNWQGQFEDWFNNVKTSLEGDVALNLQRQIDTLDTSKVNVSDKATVAEALQGTNTTHWMTPSTVKKSIDNNTTTASVLSKIPKYTIWMWYGTESSIPSGWAICNGQNGTPDLRDRFIVAIGSRYSLGSIGGNDTVTVPLPSHSHDITGYTETGSHNGVYKALSSPRGQGDVTVHSTTSGVSNPTIDNRPKYYALIFIMKL